jgi:hypothetical protein
MESVVDFLCGIFMTMFWLFRIVITALTYLGIEFTFASANVSLEIILLFVTLICIICVFKRNAIGSLAYFFMYIAYFGYDLYNQNSNGIGADNSINIMIDFVAIILASLILLNVILSKTMKISKKQKTEWFYENEKYSKETDSRDDKNNYRIY